MNWTLEVVVVPVSDVERARAFYANALGFAVDHDTQVSETRRVIQLTPPGSGCSIVLGTGMSRMTPGSLHGLQLVVRDLEAARAQLLERNVKVGEIQVIGPTGPRPAAPGEDLNYVGFLFFNDPDGNGWGIQQIGNRH
ncbi:VOC family protein [Deinococcus hopiensis]|uniref:Catechol 2,3-dioxygenase n=1 Tax=Deinococcus hopiensis KR-140 TaxID=695939 RepID=A0A1W1UTS6_9DEIO|nr:VOC family protein [Deinococcus hopiensis]SMB84507.1 Catechol 2,3-dioxygenase [Deinococcus hopiensis KR-140]